MNYFRKKEKKKLNKTGSPLLKKKKKKVPVIRNESEGVEEKRKSSLSPRVMVKKEGKIGKSKQLKMDKFITRKKKRVEKETSPRPSGSRDPDLGRRTTTVTKNYR